MLQKVKNTDEKMATIYVALVLYNRLWTKRGTDRINTVWASHSDWKFQAQEWGDWSSQVSEE